MAKHLRKLHPTLPSEAWYAYKAHKNAARRRGIGFLFTPEEWWAWWQDDDRWGRRGMGSDALVMARRGDAGPYSPENVYCATHAQNMRDIPADVRRAGIAKARATNPYFGISPGQRGDAHPRSKAVITPAGRFGSAALAAEYFGITRQHAARKARAGADGWGVVGEEA